MLKKMKKGNITTILTILIVILLVMFSCTMSSLKNNSSNKDSVSQGMQKAVLTGVTVNYTVTNDWGSGFTADVTLTNSSGSDVNGWTVSWTFPNNQSIMNLWNGSYTVSGSDVSVTNVDFNETIPNGGQITFGFQASYSGANNNPTNFIVEGGQSSSSSSKSSISSSSSSSSSSSQSGPIKIEAENWSNMYGVETEDSGEGTLSVGYIDVGDWLDYQVYIPKTEAYTMTLRVANQMSTGKIDILVDGNYQTTVNVPNTGYWYTWENITANLNLTQGNRTIRLYASGSPWNLNWFELSEGISSSSSSSSSSSHGGGPVSYYGEMKVSGNQIIGSKTNSRMMVRGMSLFWSQWSDKFWVTETVNDMYDNWKCEIIRCAMGADNHDGNHGGGWCEDPSNNERRVTTIVDAAIAKDMYVIIDWHSHEAHNVADQAKTFFRKMAQKYGHLDNVIFEIYNEPMHISMSTIQWYAHEIIPVIREYSDNLVIVGTPVYSGQPHQISQFPVNDYNTAYTFHFYAASHFGDFRARGDAALNAGYALFVTEWGTVTYSGDGEVNYGSTDEWLGWMDHHNISWCNWAINDKEEGASIYYKDTKNLTPTGQLLYDKLNYYAGTNPWR